MYRSILIPIDQGIPQMIKLFEMASHKVSGKHKWHIEDQYTIVISPQGQLALTMYDYQSLILNRGLLFKWILGEQITETAHYINLNTRTQSISKEELLDLLLEEQQTE